MQEIGLAYQIRDDLLDLFGQKEGRPAGADIADGRATGPLLHFLVQRGIQRDGLGAQQTNDILRVIQASEAPMSCLRQIEASCQKAEIHLNAVASRSAWVLLRLTRELLHSTRSLVLQERVKYAG
jgi:geranylgeranyl pyrophosphate synthase